MEYFFPKLFHISQRLFIEIQPSVYTYFSSRSMQGVVKTIDFRSQNLLQDLKEVIDSLRIMILDNRSAERYIKYQAYFFPNTPIDYVNGMKTEKNDYFQVEINAKTLYPKPIPGKQNKYELKHFRGDKFYRSYEFNPRYNGQYTVFDALGVLVAEQLRFNTLDLCKKQGVEFMNSQDMFIKIWNQYYPVYQNWAKLTEGTLAEHQRKKIPPGVEVKVKYLK